MPADASDAELNAEPQIGDLQKADRLRRLAKLLFWLPIVLAPIVLLALSRIVPDLNGNSIGDGFRKLNVWFSAGLPVVAGCWITAFAIQAYLDLRRMHSQRLRAWGVVLVLLASLIAVCAYLDL